MCAMCYMRYLNLFVIKSCYTFQPLTFSKYKKIFPSKTILNALRKHDLAT